MDRRKFLILTGVAIGGVAIPSSVFFVSNSVKKYAVLFIERELDYLILEPGSVVKYVDEYFTQTNNLLERVKWKAMYYLHVGWQKSDQILELIKYYLLSSDFFINKMDESKMVKYLGLYSPYKSPVPNPFAYTLHPPSEIKNG
ncbi:hypothetical protein DHW03_05130 [Pedobacter yonginense]|uniref:Uncharacterized protein n=1 Tax=Pedobacter yonginense TaxID=651869 RepID=A0A317EVJ6_9SPHI|nr:hypothetical protein [Pedobacter yonginense]PWS29208.1 hypothetical protein DHW03_05130 [Pedobacter yonginense]